MIALKRFIKRMFSKIGYDISVSRLSEQRASYANFVNLAQAYEHTFNQVENHIPDNNKRFEILAKLQGTLPSEAYFIVQALSKSQKIPGDICEFGVAQGETSTLIANEIQHGDKVIHLFDSFEGLPEPTEEDKLKDDVFSLGSMAAYEGTMACSENMVRSRLNDISFPKSRYVIHKGFVDKVFDEGKNLPKQVSFSYVDFDFYEPIKITLEYLHEVTPVGGIIIVDDYDYFSTGAKTAVDEFLDERNSDGLIYDCIIPDKAYGCFAVITKKV